MNSDIFYHPEDYKKMGATESLRRSMADLIGMSQVVFDGYAEEKHLNEVELRLKEVCLHFNALKDCA